MPYPILYVAITNHGYGHATRMCSVVAEIQRRLPEVLVILVTTAPRSLLDAHLKGDFIHRPIALDIGVVQGDSLTMDKVATLAKLRQIIDRSRSIIAAEVNFIRQNRVSLVLGDIPPLAAPIARAAGIPGWLIGNFGWDFIYRPWGGEFVEMANWIAAQFSQCDRLFRLPFHEPMSAFPQMIDVGLTGSTPSFSQAELRETFQLTAPSEQTILMTFGGLGVDQVPVQNLQRFPDWQFITFDRQIPDAPNLVRITDRQYCPVDFMPLCDRVISKPGYSTFAEACRMGVPIISTTREDFAEAAVLLQGIQDHAYHRILTPAEFFQGDWSFLEEPLHPPRVLEPLAKDGNQAIAQAVVQYLQLA
ncbi:MAG: glycosyl transferase [Leptolyngbyaceae cyanobacterium CRU_2_3]|nr:glycosyl transferase [Leptolyngbyaceae cyanobacterium CRU_2_3]